MFISSRIGLRHAMGGNERPWLVLGGWRPRQGERREGREAPGGHGRDGVHTLGEGVGAGGPRRGSVREAKAVKEGGVQTGQPGLALVACLDVDWEGQVRPPCRSHGQVVAGCPSVFRH